MVLSIVWMLFVSTVFTQIAVLATTIWLHRAASHHSIVLHPVAEWCFKCIIWVTTGINQLMYVAVHLWHHAKADKVGDPHSPLIEGFWQIQFGNAWYHRRAIKILSANREMLEKYSRGFPQDWWSRRVFDHGLVGNIIGVAFLCLILGFWWGLLAAAIHGIMYLFVISGLINGFCHKYGYKNFDDAPAFNNTLVALITGGEGEHNNHHKWPSRVKFSIKKGELDPAWPFVKLLIKSRLATMHETSREMSP